MGALIAGAGFISATIAPADRFEAWREAMAPSHDIRPAQAGGGAPEVASVAWHLDDLLCSDLAFSPICYRRWPGKSEGGVLLRLYEEGQARGLLKEAAFETRPGEVHLFDLAPECRGVTGLAGGRAKKSRRQPDHLLAVPLADNLRGRDRLPER